MRRALDFIADIKRAETSEELAQIFFLRYQRFVQEQGKSSPWADHNNQQLRDPCDDEASNFYLNDDNGQIVACGRGVVGGPPESCHATMEMHRFGHFAKSQLYYVSRIVLHPQRSSHLALLKLMLMLYKDARDRGATIGLAHCRPDLLSLYRRAAWLPYAPPFWDSVSGMQVPILIVAEDLETIAACNPMMLELARNYTNTTNVTDWFRQEFGNVCAAGTRKRADHKPRIGHVASSVLP